MQEVWNIFVVSLTGKKIILVFICNFPENDHTTEWERGHCAAIAAGIEYGSFLSLKKREKDPSKNALLKSSVFERH